MKRSIRLSALVVALSATLTRAPADIRVFDDLHQFLDATGATAAHDPFPNLGSIPGGEDAVYTIGTVTFTITLPSTTLVVGTGNENTNWTKLLDGNEIAISGPENLNADLVEPRYSIGFSFVEPADGSSCGCQCFDSTFAATLLSDGHSIAQFEFNAPDDTAWFVGVWSSEPFDRLEIRDVTDTCDNEFFGQFYSGGEALPPDGLRGDMNCDGVVNFNDIDPFVTALISQDDYEAEFPDCRYLNGDINLDGPVNFDDIDGFVDCLINNGCL